MTNRAHIKKYLKSNLKRHGVSSTFFRKKVTPALRLDFCNALVSFDKSFGPDGSDQVIRDCWELWGDKVGKPTPALRSRLKDVMLC